MASCSTPSAMARDSCRATPRTFRFRTAGPSLPTFAPCNAAGLPRWTTCRLPSAPRWRGPCHRPRRLRNRFMAAPATSSTAAAAISPGWKPVPTYLLIGGAVLGLIGACLPSLRQQFAHSYLLAYMFFLSICLGGLFMTLLHHLFDASWSVATRRVTEHLAWLLPVMGVLFVPIAICSFLTVNGADGSPQAVIYQWMQNDPHADHALHAKQPIFTRAGFFAITAGLFVAWWFLVRNLRRNSLEQDKTGAAIHTLKMRFHSGYGIFLFAVTLTLAAILWVGALEHQWYSTMYGVYYFAESVWTTLATLWVLTAVLARTGHL